MNDLRKLAFLLAISLMLLPTVAAEDSDGDGYEDPSVDFTIWDGADAYPNNPDIHEPVFSIGCDPPVAKLDLAEPVMFTCTIRNEGPVEVFVSIEVDEGEYLSNRFTARTYSLEPEELVEIKVSLTGLSEGFAMAELQVFARANESPSHVFELPIEVTSDEWSGLSSQGGGSSSPSISLFTTLLEEFSDWLSQNTPWEFTNMNTGLFVLVMGIALVSIMRRKRARMIWRQNMQRKSIEDGRMEARFDAIRKDRKFQYGDEPTIPDSPMFIIRRDL